jgi:hypothetical protein
MSKRWLTENRFPVFYKEEIRAFRTNLKIKEANSLNI